MARDRKTAPPEARPQWPNINKKFFINNSDYPKAYGYWRGEFNGRTSPVEAARQFLAGEKALREVVARMEVLSTKAAARGPLAFGGHETEPIKLAGGEPVAQSILPIHGERGTRTLCGLPTHRCRAPHFPEPDTVYCGAYRDQGGDTAPSDQEGETRDLASAAGRKHGGRGTDGGRRAGANGRLQSHLVKARSYSESKSLWRPPEYTDNMVKSRVWKASGYVDAVDGTLESVPQRLATSEDEFDRMSVRELLTRSLSVEPPTGTVQSRMMPSRDCLRSSASRRSTPAWARATRTHSTIIGDPKARRTCIVKPVTAKEEMDTWVKLPDNWMTRIPNLGRVKDPFCHHLCSEPLYCYNLDHARHGREPHMISSLGVYRGGPVYNVKATNAIKM
jgi:hypothetical protein